MKNITRVLLALSLVLSASAYADDSTTTGQNSTPDCASVSSAASQTASPVAPGGGSSGSAPSAGSSTGSAVQ
ncbi:MAG: hypothetical protein P4M08_08515 [Oligoflexia bacterium]|nr:hypothetical protein [Oligoflexia bacterium]